MRFNEFGNKNNPLLLLLHGMMQDWRSLYELLKPLQEHYLLILPAQDGFYEGSGDFTSFADQAQQIEKYIKNYYQGKAHGAYGVSQGALLLTELLTRNKVDLGNVIMDGCCVAHQGEFAGKKTAKMFLQYKHTGRFPAWINLMMKLMGLSKDDLGMMDGLYLDASDESIRRNFMENYTYRVRPEITENETMVHLWCGSKEPYAIKSHKELKQYLKNDHEEIMNGYGHGEFLMKHTKECCEKIRETIQ
ncbi:MAG: alpha/beta hydrolase [Erysipelotrichaceae bacterium]|nr:alpha/beta hydrolase [Erysipelotrichaceae bacterium]